jgi:hypothetical protein
MDQSYLTALQAIVIKQPDNFLLGFVSKTNYQKLYFKICNSRVQNEEKTMKRQLNINTHLQGDCHFIVISTAVTQLGTDMHPLEPCASFRPSGHSLSLCLSLQLRRYLHSVITAYTGQVPCMVYFIHSRCSINIG